MTAIYCSNKLKQLIGSSVLDLPVNPKNSLLGDWNGHLFSLDKRKCLAFVNNKTYYSLFFTDILKKDLVDFNDLFLSRLIQQLIFDRVTDLGIISLIKQETGNLTFFRTNNDKRTIGTMNDLIYQFKVHRDYKYDSLYEMDVVKENSLINDTFTKPTLFSDGKYSRPKQAMEVLIKVLIQEK